MVSGLRNITKDFSYLEQSFRFLELEKNAKMCRKDSKFISLDMK
jgi:hypothetical protein